MDHFISVEDVDNLNELARSALLFKAKPFHSDIGLRKTLGLIFFNPSLRTRLSTVKAAKNLGMDIMVMNVGSDSWQLETEEGVIMDQDKAEHVKDAAAVIGTYCDIVGVRSFPGLQNKSIDYQDKIINAFVQYTGKPVINLESATLHPLQSFTDFLTIEETKSRTKPKVVLSWAPHVKALPQAVANSFSQWMNQTDFEFVITNPKGFDLHPDFIGEAQVLHDQNEAFQKADFIYAKNWSSYEDYGKVGQFRDWTINKEKMDITNQAKFMHCLPVRRNLVVTDEVLDADSSIHVQQASNRVWAAQAVLFEILKGM